MKKLTIRWRMTLWFLLSTVLLTGLLFAALHIMTAALLQQALESSLTLAAEQIGAQIEQENNGLVYENETPIAPGISYYIMEENGSELFSYGEDIASFDGVPIHEGGFSDAVLEQQRYLVLDASPLTVQGEIVRIRVSASCAQNEETLRTMRRVFLLVLPPLALLAAGIGFLLMGRSLQPIRQMIDSARRIITAGDHTGRLSAPMVQDELGELTDTLNQMLQTLDDAFQRERRFTADASHELRTPVTVIRACTEELLLCENLPQTTGAHLHTILSECCRMQRLIEQMLTLTRAQEGRIPLRPERFAVADVLEGIRDALSDAARASGIRIQLSVPSDLTMIASQSLFTQLMLNLTENAIKYGRNGGSILLSAQEAEPGEVLLRVQDDGPGISPEDLPHIFERFYRADAARDRSGAGLGLSIAQWIVEAHGGHIQAESAPDAGTVFIIRWPAAPPAP